MRRSTPIAIYCALTLLFGAAEAIASGAGSPPPPGSKITGSVVSGTIIIGTTGDSSAAGMFAIRLTKGNLSSGAIVLSSKVLSSVFKTTPGNIADKFLGGPSTPGGLLSPYFDDMSDLIDIFSELGITINLVESPGHPLYQPVITQVDNAVCSPPPSPADEECTGALSLDVKIKFATPK